MSPESHNVKDRVLILHTRSVSNFCAPGPQRQSAGIPGHPRSHLNRRLTLCLPVLPFHLRKHEVHTARKFDPCGRAAKVCSLTDSSSTEASHLESINSYCQIQELWHFAHLTVNIRQSCTVRNEFSESDGEQDLRPTLFFHHKLLNLFSNDLHLS